MTRPAGVSARRGNANGTSLAHCQPSTTAFDAHLRRGGHVDPASVGLVLGEVAGSPCWKYPGDDDALSRKRRVNLSPEQTAGVPTPTPDRSERSEAVL